MAPTPQMFRAAQHAAQSAKEIKRRCRAVNRMDHLAPRALPRARARAPSRGAGRCPNGCGPTPRRTRARNSEPKAQCCDTRSEARPPRIGRSPLRARPGPHSSATIRGPHDVALPASARRPGPTTRNTKLSAARDAPSQVQGSIRACAAHNVGGADLGQTGVKTSSPPTATLGDLKRRSECSRC